LILYDNTAVPDFMGKLYITGPLSNNYNSTAAFLSGNIVFGDRVK